jgi:hypothetical protein
MTAETSVVVQFANCTIARPARVADRDALAAVKGPAKAKLNRFGLLDQICTDAFHLTIGAAVDAHLADHAVDWKP